MGKYKPATLHGVAGMIGWLASRSLEIRGCSREVVPAEAPCQVAL